MKINFTKMHGLGNDFIILDLRRRKIKNIRLVVKKLSHRRFGVGFDQAIILAASKKADFRMDIYNADGGRVEMCGNGIRCLARYIWSRGLSRKKRFDIETMAGVIRPEKVSGGKAGDLVRVDMGAPVLAARLIPAAVDDDIVDRPVSVGGKTFLLTCVSMGNPHAVIFVKKVDGFPVEDYGPLIERHRLFPKGTNVEFVEVVSRSSIKMRVWERGAGETLACGTGASAAAVAAAIKGLTGRRVTVKLLGGNLKIEWSKTDDRVYMTGPAVEVFTGTVVV